MSQVSYRYMALIFIYNLKLKVVSASYDAPTVDLVSPTT